MQSGRPARGEERLGGGGIDLLAADGQAVLPRPLDSWPAGQ
jgi:hypothetical protein